MVIRTARTLGGGGGGGGGVFYHAAHMWKCIDALHIQYNMHIDSIPRCVYIYTSVYV